MVVHLLRHVARVFRHQAKNWNTEATGEGIYGANMLNVAVRCLHYIALSTVYGPTYS